MGLNVPDSFARGRARRNFRGIGSGAPNPRVTVGRGGGLAEGGRALPILTPGSGEAET